MGLFNKIDPKFVKLVDYIDQRMKVYELLLSGSEPHPKGLDLILQEFKILKLKAWDIERGSDMLALIKELQADEIREKIKDE